MRPLSPDRAPWRARIDRWLALGIPYEALPGELRPRIQIVTLVTAAMVSLALPFALQLAWLGAPLVSLAVLTAIAVGVGNLAVLSQTHNPQIAGIVGAGSVFLVLLVSNLYSGGFSGSGFGWFYVVPMLAALLVDARAGWAFTAVVLVTTVGFWGLEQSGTIVPDVVPSAWRPVRSLADRVSAVLTVGIVLAALATREHGRLWLGLSGPFLVDEDEEPTDEVPRRVSEPDDEPPEPPTSPIVDRALRILAIDYEVAPLVWLQAELTEHDVHVTTEPHEAVTSFVEEDYDVLLCSLSLPGAGGQTIHLAIQAQAPERARRIVCIADGHEAIDTTAFAGDRAVLILRKPLDPDELRRALLQAARDL